jgi:hypothetical protein
MKILMRIPVTMAALLLTGAGLVAGAPGASAATSPAGSEGNVSAQINAAASAAGLNIIRNAAYGGCVDAPGGAFNVQLKLARCVEIDPNVHVPRTRQWALVPTGAANTFFIVNADSGLCMEVNDGTSTPGERVDEFTCNGMPSEQWVLDVGLTFRHAGTNQCLDTVGGPGTQLMQFTCGQESPRGVQSWIITAVTDL